MPMLVMSVFCMIAGAISDKFGRKWLLVGASCIYGIAGMSPIFLEDLTSILASRFVLGLAEAFVMVIGLALVSDFFTGTQRERILAMQVTVASIGAFSFNIIGGFLGEISWHAAYYPYSFAFIVALLSAIFLWEPNLKSPAQDGETEEKADDLEVKQYVIWFMGFLAAFIGLAFLMGPINFGLLFEAIGVISPKQISLAYALNSLGIMGGTLFFGWIMSGRFSTARQLAMSFFIMAIGFFGMWYASTFISMTVFAIVLGFGCGMTIPSFTVWVASLFPARIRGFGMGINISGQFFGNFVGGATLAWLVSLFGGRELLMMGFGFIMLGASFVGLLFVWTAKKQPNLL